jgi:hypothetical protein
MRLTTIEELRDCYAEKIPLFIVTYMPYHGIGESLDVMIPDWSGLPRRSRDRGYGYGSEEDIYTTISEARHRFAEVARPGLTESATLDEVIYPSGGGRAQRPIDDWKDAEDDPESWIASAEHILAYHEDSLPRDEYAQTQKEKNVLYAKNILKKYGVKHSSTGSGLARLELELLYAKQDYAFWARQEHRLSKDEYAQKIQAEKKIREIEARIGKRKR